MQRVMITTTAERADAMNARLLNLLAGEEMTLIYTGENEFTIECPDAQYCADVLVGTQTIDPTLDEWVIEQGESDATVAHVDFVGRWIAEASTEDLIAKRDEYRSRAHMIGGRDAHLIFNTCQRISRELVKRRDCGNAT